MASITGLCQADCDQKAVWYCVEDKADLCDSHKIQMHTMKIQQAHKIVPIGDKLQHCRPADCPAHFMPLSLYCQKCENLCCLACVTMGIHKEHNNDAKPLMDVANTKRNEINEIIEKTETIAIRLEEERKLLQESIQCINNSETKVEKETKDIFDRIRVYIDQREKDLKEKLKKMGQDCRGNINSRQTDLNQIIEKVQGFLKEARQTNELNDFAMIAKVPSIKNGSEDNQSAISQYLRKPSLAKPIIFQCDPDNIFKSMKTTFDLVDIVIPNLPVNARWEQQGSTVAGGNGQGANNNQLNGPHGLFVDDDDDQTIVIADCSNHRVMQWKRGDTQGRVVAGGNGQGNRLDQLLGPTDVLIDKETNSLLIADSGNRRVVRWSRRSGTTQGDILIENITCYGLAMDEHRNLYVSNTEKYEVRRYEIDRGDKNGTVVAGGNGRGNGLNQLDVPTYLFVDRNRSLYVSDWRNHRVMKWDKGAAQGFDVVGGQGAGSALVWLHFPHGIFVDTFGTLYVVEAGSNRVTRWPQGPEKKGTVEVGGGGYGSVANQLKSPIGLSFDKHGNLYVVEYLNHRVQRFNLIQ